MVDILSHLEDAESFTAKAKGKVILYISDTLTAQYPALQALVEAVRPAAIIHTGDSVDEYKVGRVEADRIPYEAGMKELMKILNSADCPLYFTSGNNDDLNLITGLPRVTVVPHRTVITVEGVRFLLDHYPITDAGDVDFALSGHTGKSDFHYPPQDREGEAVYVNGMFHWALIDSATKQFLRIPCKKPLKINETTDENGVRIRTFGDKDHLFPPEKKWILTQTHLHAGYENFSSIRSHAAEAKRMGYNALFITEHDIRMNRMPGCIEHFHLTAAGEALREDGKAGWYREEDVPAESVAHGEGFALRLRDGESAFFASAAKRHQASLLSGFTVSLTMDLAADTALLVDFTLSQRPDNLEQQHLVYGLDATCDNDWFLPLERTADGVYTFPLSEDVLKFDVFGQDNAFLTVTVTPIGGEVKVLEMNTTRKYVAEEVRKRQKTIGNHIGKEYKIKVCSGFEVTFGHHRNCFSSHVPVINYEETGYVHSDKTESAYLRSKNATFAHNHMFQKHNNAPEEEHEAIIQELIETLAETHCEGAQLLEVGFPHKKKGFTIEEHLRVWDALGVRGVRMVGYGDSDSHNSKTGWEHGNCFGSWVLAEHAYQEHLERAMRAGRVCLGNPAKWKSKWEYTVDEAIIGDILQKDTATAHIRLWELTEPVELRVIRAGEELCRYPINEAAFETELSLERGDCECCPVRLEVWSENGKPLFFTNPIYLIQ